jgi:carbon-monoxide dehydrogenase large subunit
MHGTVESGRIGDSVLRKEDRKFLLGKGRFVDDMHLPGETVAAFVRSPHGHADIISVDVSAARSMPGVVAVYCGADMAADGVGSVPFMWLMRNDDGTPMAQPPRWPIARDRVRHAGEPVAIVIAETRAQAEDAAEAVHIDYAPRPAVADIRAAIEPGASAVHDEAPENRIYSWGRGPREATEAAIADAAHVIELELINNRIACAALEGRVCLATHDPLSDSTTLYNATQAPHLIRRSVTEALGLAPDTLRVVAPDVGGGFGTKGKHYPEETVLVWAARRLGRPIRWTSSRSEAFMSDTQARDHLTRARLGVDDDGRFVGLQVETFANVGAYISTFGASIPGAIYSALLAGVYSTPAVHVQVTGVLTNTVPTDAYRGAGRPEACYVLERLADEAAHRLGLTRDEIRRRNLIPADAMPYATPIGPTYDTGDFPKIMGKLLDAGDWSGFEARRAASAARGLLRGIGLAMYVETSGVAPSKLAGMLGARIGFFESAEIRIDANGGAQILAGTHNHGQGHDTTYAQIVADRLGLDYNRIRVVEGDTAAVPMGTGTFGSRSIAVGGSAIAVAADKIVAKGKRIAASLLEAADEDIDFRDGTFSVTGTDRTVTIADVANAANLGHLLPDGVEPGLNESAFYDPTNFAYSNGGHLVEIEIDPDTGSLEICRYYVVDDIGTVINPMIVEAQIHGGLAQGIGQALHEMCVYEDDSGQILSGSFLDYAIPRADDLVDFEGEFDESQPCTHNPLGAKGCGESGSIGAPAALVSAALDALSPLGVRDLEIPLTPHRIWQAIRDARTSPS